MTQMVLVLPLLIFILVMVMFWGQALTRIERTMMNVRYENWRAVSDAPGPSADGTSDNPQLNETFFGSNADLLEIEHDRYTTSVEDEWVSQATVTSNETADFTQSMIDSLPAHLATKIRVDHELESQVLEPFNEGVVLRRHRRLRGDWRYADGLAWDSDNERWEYAGPHRDHDPAIRDRYLTDIDSNLEPLASGNTLARHIRGVYLGNPGYRGPEVEVGP